MQKTRLIIWYVANDTQGHQATGFIDTIIEEDPTEVTKQSTLNLLFDGLKRQMATQGFIAAAIVPTNIFRIAADVEMPQIVAPTVPDLMPNRELRPRNMKR